MHHPTHPARSLPATRRCWALFDVLETYESRGAVPQNAPTRGLRDLNPPRPTVTHRDDALPTGLA